jgi:hypothetical protein
MRSKIIFTVLILFTISIFAQKQVAKDEDLQKFYKTKTLVVLEGNPMSSFNFKIRDVMKKEWKITEYDFIELNDYEKMRRDPQYSFLTLDDVYFEKDKQHAEYAFVCVSLGGKYPTMSDMPQLACFPLAYRGVEEEYFAYKLTAVVMFLQNHIKLTTEKKILSQANIINYYNSNAPTVKDKTVYCVKDELSSDINTESKFAKKYPYKFKFVTREELESIIDAQEANAVFFHKVGPTGSSSQGRVYKIFMGVDGVIYYFGYHKISGKKPDKLLDKDIRILVRE